MKNYLFFIIFRFILLIIFAFFLHEYVLFSKENHIVYNQIGGGSRFVHGPLLDGCTISHDFYLDKKIEFNNNSKINLCIYILMANYSGAKHGSNLEYFLQINGKILNQIRSVDKIKDNSFYRVCFDIQDQVPFIKGKMRFGVKSIGARLGQAVTCWLSPDLRQGETLINDMPSGGSLVFRIVLEQSKSHFFVAVIAFFVFIYYLVLIFVLEKWIAFLFSRKK
jgi:hypothetical protein